MQLHHPIRLLLMMCLIGCLLPISLAKARDPKCFDRKPTILGTDGDDVIRGTKKRDVIQSLHGNDTIRSGGGNDFVCASTGRDTVYGGRGRDQINGGPDEYSQHFLDEFHNILYGGPGDDDIEGGADTDYLFGGPGDDRMEGTSRAGDEFYPGPGNDILIGSGREEQDEQSEYESDMAVYKDLGGPIRANVSKGVVHAQGKDVLRGIRSLEGTEFDDVLVGDEYHNILVGWGGNDLIRSLGVTDDCASFDSKCWPDIMWGGEGDDELHGVDGESVWVAFDTSITPLHVDLGLGTATGEGEDELIDVNRVALARDLIQYSFGCPADSPQSSLIGNDQSNILRVATYCLSGDYLIRGLGSSDSLRADGAKNQIEGGEGNDFIVSTSGIANLLGEAGDDFLSALDSDAGDTVDGGEGTEDECKGDAGDSVLNCEE